MSKKKPETSKEWEARRQKNIEIVMDLRLIDDIFMTVALKDNPKAVECILRILLKDPTLKVETVKVQDVYANLSGRGVRLDIHAIDGQGRHFDIEMQRASAGISPKRLRHNGALMDSENVPKGGDPEALPCTYIIFICEKDPFNKGRALYPFEMYMKDELIPHNDGMHYLYMNTEYQGNDDLGKLAKDLCAKNAEEMYFQPLAEAVNRVKGSKKGVTHMCDLFEKYGNERYVEGHEEGIEAGLLMAVQNLVKNSGMPVEQAVMLLGIPEQDRQTFISALISADC